MIRAEASHEMMQLAGRSKDKSFHEKAGKCQIGFSFFPPRRFFALEPSRLCRYPERGLLGCDLDTTWQPKSDFCKSERPSPKNLSKTELAG
jgi:hypothetical protein